MAKSKKKEYYFDNEHVESLVTKYVKGGCVDIKLRNEIMGHAGELIRNVIRVHNFHNIYPGKDEASFQDLYQVAWIQLELVLYKFDSGPKHTKLFNMWSQVSKTVILAYIKKETKDKRNFNKLQKQIQHRIKSTGDNKLERFIQEATTLTGHNTEFELILEVIRKLYREDAKPYEGLIGKLIKKTKLSRSKILNFLKMVRLRSSEFTDSPINTQATKITLDVDDPSEDDWN